MSRYEETGPIIVARTAIKWCYELERLKNTKIKFFTVLEVESPKSRGQEV